MTVIVNAPLKVDVILRIWLIRPFLLRAHWLYIQ